MISDPDHAIRLSAFSAIKRLTDIHGAVLHWDTVAQGFEHGGQHIHFASRARGIFRPKEMTGGALSVKTTVPRRGRTARYEDLLDPKQTHIHYCFQGDDPEGRDNQLLERCGRLKAPLIYFFGIDEGLYAPLWPVFIDGMDRQSLRANLVVDNKIVLDDVAGTGHGQEATLIRRYQTIEARKRLHQAAFSALVLRAYNERCAVCNLPRVRMLVEAAHIVPDVDEQGLPEVRNGLALCCLHHAAFDADLLGIRPDRVIELSERVLQEHDGPVLQYGIKEFQGKEIRVPRRVDEQPGVEYLEIRYQNFRVVG